MGLPGGVFGVYLAIVCLADPIRQAQDSSGFKSKKSFGGDLLSRESALRLPSALTGFTTGFEM